MGCPVLDSELEFTPILEEIGANIARSGFYFLPNLTQKKEYRENRPGRTACGEASRTTRGDLSRTTKYLYDGLSVVIERNESDETLATYTRGLSYGGGIGGIISVTKTDPKCRHHGHKNKHCPDTRTSYFHYNGIGSVTALTDEQGVVVQEYEYDAYGNLLSADGDIANSYMFSTKEYSSKSGLSYFGARYYDSNIGRWTQKDPLGMINGPNKYLYCNNNPIDFIDPWGLRKGGNRGGGGAGGGNGPGGGGGFHQNTTLTGASGVGGGYDEWMQILGAGLEGYSEGAYGVAGAFTGGFVDPNYSLVAALGHDIDNQYFNQGLLGGRIGVGSLAAAGVAQATGFNPWLAGGHGWEAHAGGPHTYEHVQVVIRTFVGENINLRFPWWKP